MGSSVLDMVLPGTWCSAVPWTSTEHKQRSEYYSPYYSSKVKHTFYLITGLILSSAKLCTKLIRFSTGH